MGAAGRDFHNFNVYFRYNEGYEVVAFTASQIPGIKDRTYPADLAGPAYPKGVPIYGEEELPHLIKKDEVKQVVLAYSDLTHEEVMHKASVVLASGADFRLMGPRSTMLKAKVPVISVCAVRTGAGKSTTTRRVCDLLAKKGCRLVIVRHPMPYGNLSTQACQRFTSNEDLERYECTVEEREEYEPYVEGFVVYAGVDYEKILRKAEDEADILVWDGGNNDTPFYEPDLHVVVADPHRPGQEVASHPGEVNVRMADVVIINKVDTAQPGAVETVRRNIKTLNPRATVIDAASPVSVDKPQMIEGKRVLVVEDGPTLTHGNMGYGAGTVAAKKFGAAMMVDPRPYACGSIRELYDEYPHIGPVLPAVGYSKRQLKELETTIKAVDCDSVVLGTSADLQKIIELNKPVVKVKYELQEVTKPDLEDVLSRFLESRLRCV